MTGAQPPAGGRIVTFYSYKGGTGRTMALANAAWILAAAGHRVLMIDWDLEAPGLHRFFEPFLDPALVADRSGIVNIIDSYCRDAEERTKRGERLDPSGWWDGDTEFDDNTLRLDWPFGDGGSLHYISAGRANPVFSTGLAVTDWDKFYNLLGGSGFLDAMRLRLKQTYDYVVIDSRTGKSDIETICTKDLPDDLVVCFTLSGQNIDGSVDLAKHVDEIRRANPSRDPVRVLPVVTRVDIAENERLQIGLAVARARFDRFVQEIAPDDPDGYWNVAQIPYKPFYAYEEMLAVFGDAPGNRFSVLSAIEGVVGLLTAGAVTRMAPMDEAVRERILKLCLRKAPPTPSDVNITHVAADQIWADWLAWLLQGAGFRVGTDAVAAASGRAMDAVTAEQMRAAPHTVVVVSAAYQQSELARSLWQARNSLTSARIGQLVAVNVDPVGGGSPLRWSPSIETVNRSQEDVAAAVLQALGSTMTFEEAAAAAQALETPPARYPLSRPDHWNLPNRIAGFTGREEVLATIRENLTSGSATIMYQQHKQQAIVAGGGYGKTALALEYAHRAQHDYDIVWWIRAEHRNYIKEDLADLARELRFAFDSIDSGVKFTMEALRTGTPSARWLLIYDNAEDPSKLELPAPSPTGHVLITSRDATSSNDVLALPIDVFSRGESVNLLQARVYGITDEEADRVAERLGDLPLAIEIAASVLTETGIPVDAYLTLLDTELTATLELGHAHHYPTSIVEVWRVAAERIAETSPAAFRLLQLLAFFGPEPIAANLVYGDAMADALAEFDPGLKSGKGAISRYVQLLNKYGLVKIARAGNKPIQMHRLIQQVVRDGISDPAEQARLRRTIHTVLVAARPAQGDVDNPGSWPAYGDLWPHLLYCDARSGDAAVRQLCTDRVRYLRLRGEDQEAVNLAEDVIAYWESTPEIGADDARNLSMRFELANALRKLGSLERALEIDQDVHRRQQEHPDLGAEHIATLITAGGLASDYRALGQFARSLEVDQQTFSEFTRLFGSDHPRTLLAASNLAVALRVVGRPFEAQELDRRTYRDRLEILGPTHPMTYNSAINLARDMRDCGDRDSALDMLATTYQDASANLGESAPSTVQAARALSTSYRKAARYEEAEAVFTTLRIRLGDPETVKKPQDLGYALAVAAYRAARGDVADALRLGQITLDSYHRQLPQNHPDTLICTNNVAVYLRRLGRNADSLPMLQSTFDTLTAKLGPSHPATLGCAVNLANSLAESGEKAVAEQLYLQTADRLRELLKPAAALMQQIHPDLLACEANLAITWYETGRTDKAEEERTRIKRLLPLARGANHPGNTLLDNWIRTDRYLDTTPL